MEEQFNIKGLIVYVKDKNLEKAIKAFKRKVKESKVILEYNARMFYQKPSVLKKKKRLSSIKKMKKIMEEIK